jgi:hypothetical protein
MNIRYDKLIIVSVKITGECPATWDSHSYKNECDYKQVNNRIVAKDIKCY